MRLPAVMATLCLPTTPGGGAGGGGGQSPTMMPRPCRSEPTGDTAREDNVKVGPSTLIVRLKLLMVHAYIRTENQDEALEAERAQPRHAIRHSNALEFSRKRSGSGSTLRRAPPGVTSQNDTVATSTVIHRGVRET